MRAISLTQPYAQLVVEGIKSVETRSWRTTYRGEVAIHASARFPNWAKRLCGHGYHAEDFDGALLALLPSLNVDNMPLGAIVGVATIYDCVPVEMVRDNLSQGELEAGDYSNGRWAWLLHNDERLTIPVTARGALGIWQVQPIVEMTVNHQLGRS